jgi:hypothetical protein
MNWQDEKRLTSSMLSAESIHFQEWWGRRELDILLLRIAALIWAGRVKIQLTFALSIHRMFPNVFNSLLLQSTVLEPEGEEGKPTSEEAQIESSNADIYYP